jgi:hypothetical protein
MHVALCVAASVIAQAPGGSARDIALPRATLPEQPIVPVGVETEVREVRVLPWVTLGLSAVALGVGAYFAVETTKLLNQDLALDVDVRGSTVTIPKQLRDHQRDIFLNGLGATVLISAGVSGLLASILSLAD